MGLRCYGVRLRRSKGVATLTLGLFGAVGVTYPSNCVFCAIYSILTANNASPERLHIDGL